MGAELELALRRRKRGVAFRWDGAWGSAHHFAFIHSFAQAAQEEQGEDCQEEATLNMHLCVVSVLIRQCDLKNQPVVKEGRSTIYPLQCSVTISIPG